MGKKCPKCGKSTLWKTPTGAKCSNPNCNYLVVIPANNGKGGKGKLCPICEKYQMFNGKCRNCGTFERR